MILHLRLKNWRAYDALDLELGPGTTFIVASNGVGKTSLVMAAAWGIFGDLSQVNATEERRLDADHASVEVVLRLPDGSNLTIRRSVDRRGHVTLGATHADRPLDGDDAVRALLAEHMGAELGVLSRLTFMSHGGSLQAEHGEFNLHSHLASLFGVGPLLQAANAADDFASEATTAIRKLKTIRRDEGRSRESLTVELTATKEALTEAHTEQEAAEAALKTAEESLRMAADWARYRTALEKRGEAVAAVARRAGMTGLIDDPSSIEEGLKRQEQKLQHDLVTLERRLAAAQVELQITNSAASAIESSREVCPTCLRPLNEHDTRYAVEQHESRRAELFQLSADTDALIKSQESELAGVRSMLADLHGIPTPTRPPGDELAPDALASAQDDLEGTRDRVKQIDQLVGGHNATVASCTEALEQMADEERLTKQLTLLIRQEALGQAAKSAWVEAADAITARQIDPLAMEIGRRWKQVFGSGGLQLSARGELTRVVGSRTLPFRSFSGGEKVWGLLLTRLLVTAASTRAPFVWLDEPLEHLDPRLRRLVAGTIARATDAGGIRQIVVTTYEAEVARQLMEDVKSASLLYVRAAE